MIDVLGSRSRALSGRIESKTSTSGTPQVRIQDSDLEMHGHGKKAKTLTKWSTTRGTSKRNQSVPANPADRPNPEEDAFPWRDIGDLDTDPSFLYPDSQGDEECPVPKNDYLNKEHQQALHAVNREDS